MEVMMVKIDHSERDILMKITTKRGVEAEAKEKKLLVGKTPHGRDVFAIIAAEDLEKHSVERIQSSVMEYLKQHPSLTETKGRKFKIPLQPVPSSEAKTSTIFSSIKELETLSEEEISAPSTSASTSPVRSESVKDPFEGFEFDRSEQILRECQDQAEQLQEQIEDLIENPDIIFTGEINIYVDIVLDVLRDFTSIKPSNFNVHFGLTALLSEKMAEISRIVEESIQFPGKEVENLDLKILALKRLISEIQTIGAVPANQSILRFVVEDREIRNIWSRHLAEKGQTAPYLVPFHTFYDKLILNIFPEMKGDQEFRHFMSELMNFAGEKEISAWSWNQFVEMTGSIDEFRRLILENRENPDFIREYLTGLNEMV